MDKQNSSHRRLLLGPISFVTGTASLVLFVQTLLESQLLMSPYLSSPAWQSLIRTLGGHIELHGKFLSASLPVVTVGGILLGCSALLWIVGAWLLRGPGGSFVRVWLEWGYRGWRWWWLFALWVFVSTISVSASLPGLVAFLVSSSPMWVAVVLSLFACEGLALRRNERQEVIASVGQTHAPMASNQKQQRWLTPWRLTLLAVLLYSATFTAMNWGLWFNLQIPHGDSAMYEEHLWNLEHGRGFRSYLDQGLFLGEHIQVIHLLLLPLHLLWPSHLLLELCESLALASTAIPLFWIARRHSGSGWAAFYLAVACLLGFPLQYLDISIDFKTFRPISFGVPLLMFAIDQMERRRWKTMTLLLLLTLSAKEDFAIPISLIGLWLAWRGDLRFGESSQHVEEAGDRKKTAWIGAAICLSAAVYLFLAVKIVIPWFRGGETVHYARYFAKFGQTPWEILVGMLTRPRLLWTEIVDAQTFLYAASLLVPLGFLPLLSPSRLLLGLPLFGLLCLNELALSPPGPYHHFHAPLLPLLYWSAAAGLGALSSRCWFSGKCSPEQNSALCGARFAAMCALGIGLTNTLSPLGTRFWDPGRIVAGRPTYWRSLYLPDERARRWEQIAKTIPKQARVASTDFVHARLTHCERSYDYSGYARRVAGYEHRVPEDTDYIVLDLQHPYSRDVLQGVTRPSDVRELQTEPEAWDVVTEATDEFFIVLRRKNG